MIETVYQHNGVSMAESDLLAELRRLARRDPEAMADQVLTLAKEIRRLRVGLESLRAEHHLTCHVYAFGDGRCGCGAAEHNARLDALLAGAT